MENKRIYDQNRAPIYEALQTFRQMRVVPFDVPGHKRGRGNPELTEFLGEQCVSIDVNSMKPLDNLCHPISVIRQAEELAADAFGAAHAFLMVGGTTSSVQTMVLSVCKRGDKIIMPRNVHRSVINALVLCGAIPVYVNPEVDHRLGISLGMKRDQVAKAIQENPDAVAVLVNNPTYYGICSDLRSIVKMAHDAGMYCLADEAHGTHFYFGENMPVSAMAAGADMASVSMHKSGGSLTQSSLLLIGPNINEGHVRQIINLTQTTSGSYLLMSSLDISRRNLALRGKNVFRQVVAMAEYAREEINAIGGYYAFGRELVNGDSIFDFDPTKLSVHTRDIGLAGIQVYDLLRDEYDIQIEFGDIGNILAYLTHMKCLENVGMLSTIPIEFEGQQIVPIKFLKALLPDPASLGPRTHGKTNIGCIFTGKKDGKDKTYYIYNVCDHQECYKEVASQAISYTTGVPAMCGALMLLTGKWTEKGVHTVEEFDPDPFLDALDKYGLPRSENHNPVLVD